MDNIYGYVRWMGGFTFEEKDFNDIDAIVLCALSYYELKLRKDYGNTPLSLRETYRRIMAETGDPPFYTAVKNEWSDDFCGICAKSARFGSMLVKNYTESLDHENAVQFAAVTFEQKHLFNFIAFRGTDDTLAGWKEDFMISFTRTQAQELALRYAQENIISGADNRIGGHSKGANLALYASAYLKFEQWDMIEKVYLLDGPGFCPEVLDTSDIAKVNRRAIRIVPEFCIIGKLFEPEIKHTVIVKSTGDGLLQHELFTWGIQYGELVTTEQIDEQSEKLNGLINRWIENIDQSERETFINELFDALTSDGALTVSDIMEKGPDSIENIVMTLLSGSHTTRKAVASLPEQAIFGNTFSKIKEVGLFRWLKECRIVKDVLLIGIGLFFVLASDRALDITAMIFFLALTAVELVLTVRRLAQGGWSIGKVKERFYILAALIAICIVIVVKDQALFMLGSLLYGILSLIAAFRQLSSALDKNDDILMRIIHGIETAALFFFGVTFLIISSDQIYGYALFVGILLMIDGVSRIAARIYRNTHPEKPRRERRSRTDKRMKH
ncbi:MAG: DUF2974 domain-containing protein [Ruminococcus sp.]|nr:DUF2974 domain-containing protein [Ruminococcus sp.]